MYVYGIECKPSRNWYFVAVAWSFVWEHKAHWTEESPFLLPVAVYPLALAQSVLLFLQRPGQPPYNHVSLYPFHPLLVFEISTPQSIPPQGGPILTLSGLSHLPPHRRCPCPLWTPSQNAQPRSRLPSTRICSLFRRSWENTFCSTQAWAICGWPICTVHPFQQARTRPDLLIILKPFNSAVLEFTNYFSTREVFSEVV